MITEDMPTLSWMGRKDATNATKDVVMKILREDKSLSYAREDFNTEAQRHECGARTSAAPTLFDFPETGRGRSPVSPERSELCEAKWLQVCAPTTDNILVHGDNLDALHALLPFYAGRVKCIYIDPPYNTGSAFEHYDDNLEHSTWLSLMYPRLKLLWDFLSEDGSIWISIDDDEQAYLKVMCDEIFGRQNFIAANVWQKRYSREGREAIGDSHEYVLTYAKDPKRFKETRNLLPFTDKQTKIFKNPDNDPRGPWQSVSMLAQGFRPNQMYEIVAPNGTVHRPPEGNCWRHIKSEYDKLVADRRMYFGPDGNNVPRKKAFLSEAKGLVPWTWLPHEEVGHTDEAKKEINVLFGSDNAFATPKPERLIQRILTIATNPGDLVLDSFLGSGTTAAVAQKMGRRWIGIEMGEHAKTHCAVRLKKVIDGEQGGITKAVNWKGGGSFRFYELGEPILKRDGTLTENIPFETMAAHVWFTQTKRPFGTQVEKVGGGGEWKKSTFLGVHDDVAYALLYNGILGDKRVSGGNVLTKKTLKIIRDDMNVATTEEERGKMKSLVIYGEASRLADETLKNEKIDFRQTPYDLVVRK